MMQWNVDVTLGLGNPNKNSVHQKKGRKRTKGEEGKREEGGGKGEGGGLYGV